MWILKPAENSNRGNGIQITTSQEELMNVIFLIIFRRFGLIIQFQTLR